MKRTSLFPWLRPLLFVGGLSVCVQAGSARDVFVLVSGGDSPFENAYSQYLQARAVVTSWERNYPPESVYIFFGAGNAEGQPAVLNDVRRQLSRDRFTLDSWLAGSLPNNRPADRRTVLRVLREEILPAVADGGTLYLFVGDHGARPRGENAESIINLWSWERDPESQRGWRTREDATLGVRELRRLLNRGLGRGRVVFCMTQCHAGGFHYLTMPRTMTPNPGWFQALPRWAEAENDRVFPQVAGFTATDEYSAAAGCDPAPTIEGWAGYERFIPEQLFGIDPFTLRTVAPPLESFVQAHQAATLVDRTIDNPYSTSDQYLERWAHLIENRLTEEKSLTPSLKRHVEAYHRAVDGAETAGRNRAFRQRRALFGRFTRALAEQNPTIGELLFAGTREDLEAAIEGGDSESEELQEEPRERRRRRRGRSEDRASWTETLRPAWTAAVRAGEVDHIAGLAIDFEQHLLDMESDGSDFFSGRRRAALAEEVFWESGHGDPLSVDPARAEAIALWAAQRRSKILAWAGEAGEDPLREAARNLARRAPPRGPDSTGRAAEPEQVSRETAATRVLFYRRVLAAWEFLLAVRERPALRRLQELIELERTPFPKS